MTDPITRVVQRLWGSSDNSKGRPPRKVYLKSMSGLEVVWWAEVLPTGGNGGGKLSGYCFLAMLCHQFLATTMTYCGGTDLEIVFGDVFNLSVGSDMGGDGFG